MTNAKNETKEDASSKKTPKSKATSSKKTAKKPVKKSVKKETPKAEKNSLQRFVDKLKTDKPTQMVTIMIVVLVIVGSIIGVLLATSSGEATDTDDLYNINVNVDGENTNEVVEEIPTELPRKIDGVVVETEYANKVPACVMIENAAFGGVRPQSGLSQANVVYEVIVEGGITRLMAVFAGDGADDIGPVRSARDTYLEFASELNCAYAHAGGSFTAMQALQNFEMRDIDGLRESNWFYRKAGKVSPHNFYTSSGKLEEAITFGHSWDDVEYDSWTFEDDDALEEREDESAREVTVQFGGAYDAKYVYNEDNGNYERWDGGVEHTDANTGDVLTTENIIIQHVPPGASIEGKGRINFSVTGEGEVEIYRNGTRTTGYWQKPDRVSRTQFIDDDGNNIPLARGTSWVEIVPEGIGVEWTE